MPSLAGVTPKREVSSQTRRSQAAASWVPPPTAQPCTSATVGLPYGVWVHGGDDTAGALRSIERITGALRWRQVAAPLSVTGAPSAADRAACAELVATVGVSLGP